MGEAARTGGSTGGAARAATRPDGAVDLGAFRRGRDAAAANERYVAGRLASQLSRDLTLDEMYAAAPPGSGLARLLDDLRRSMLPGPFLRSTTSVE